MAAFFGMQSQPQIDVIEDMASSFLASASSFWQYVMLILDYEALIYISQLERLVFAM